MQVLDYFIGTCSSKLNCIFIRDVWLWGEHIKMCHTQIIQDTFIDGMHDFIMILGNMLESNGTVALGRSVRPLHKK